MLSSIFIETLQRSRGHLTLFAVAFLQEVGKVSLMIHVILDELLERLSNQPFPSMF